MAQAVVDVRSHHHHVKQREEEPQLHQEPQLSCGATRGRALQTDAGHQAGKEKRCQERDTHSANPLQTLAARQVVEQCVIPFFQARDHVDIVDANQLPASQAV